MRRKTRAQKIMHIQFLLPQLKKSAILLLSHGWIQEKGDLFPPPPHQFIGAWKISCKKNLCCGNHIRIGKFFSMFCEWVFLSIDQCNLMQHHFDSNFRIYRYLSAGLPHLINPGSAVTESTFSIFIVWNHHSLHRYVRISVLVGIADLSLCLHQL